jgi:prevent-host-death family protein
LLICGPLSELTATLARGSDTLVRALAAQRAYTVLQRATGREVVGMTEIASRELRNDTAGVLRRVEAGESLTVTSNGRPVAQLVPMPRSRRAPMKREELVRLVREAQADPGLRDDLRELAGETTDDLGPIR